MAHLIPRRRPGSLDSDQSVGAAAQDKPARVTLVSDVAKRRMEQPLDGIRVLEMRLARLEEAPPSRAAYMRPEQPLSAYPDLQGRPQNPREEPRDV